MAKFSLSLPPFGRDGKVIIDGVDIATVVTDLRLEAHVSQIPVLALQLRGDAEVTGEGFVEIHRPPATTNIVEWLDGIDPAWLDEAALRDADLSTSVMAGVLAVLRAKAVAEGEGE